MSDRENINATLNRIEGSVGANELSAHQVFTRMKRLVQAAQAQAQQPVVPEWVSVDDRLPEAETPVLAILDGYSGLLTVERRWEHCNEMTEPYYKDFLYWD